MRNSLGLSKWSFCLVIAALAGCSSGASDNNFAATDAVDANAAAAAGPAPGANAASGDNAASSGDNAAAGDNEAATAEANGAAAGGTAATFRASGSEPFWSLTLSSKQMVYDSADGPDITVATPKAQQTRSGPMYVTPELTVRIKVVQNCTHEDGETEGDTVTVTVGGQTLTGCGNGNPPA